MIVFTASPVSKIGNSLLGNVANEYFPFLVDIFNLSPDKVSSILLPSGINLHKSLSFLADAVVTPSVSQLSVLPIIVNSDSRSVATNLKELSLNSIRIFDNIGNVCFFSTIPPTRERALVIDSLLIVAFINWLKFVLSFYNLPRVRAAPFLALKS